MPWLAVIVAAVLDPGLGVPAIAAIAITVAALTAVAMRVARELEAVLRADDFVARR